MEPKALGPALLESLADKFKNLAYQASDIDQCAAEPIANCGAIQPFSLLLAVHQDRLSVEAYSDNWREVVGPDAEECLLGKPLVGILDLPAFDPSLVPADLCRLLQDQSAAIKSDALVRCGFVLTNCYHSEPHLILEFESDGAVQDKAHLNQANQTMLRLKGSNTLDHACQLVCEQIYAYAQYDRVMIYAFDQQWNGEVIAESKGDRLEPFLHLKYPATDIPPQARLLLAGNKSRIIADIRAEAVPIRGRSLQAKDVDLGPAVGRAVSPFHLQYLEHMGVRASCSFPVIADDRLWGLVACHHYTGPKKPTLVMRSGIELYAQILSAKIDELTRLNKNNAKYSAIEFVHSFLNILAVGHDLGSAFEKTGPRLLELTASTGAFVKVGTHQTYFGQPVQSTTLATLVNKLKVSGHAGVWQSDCLKADLGLAACDPAAAGALAVPLDSGFRDLVIWFRPEQAQEVHWGGDPGASAKDDCAPKLVLCPRQSFTEWRQLVTDRCRPWNAMDVECAKFFLTGYVQETLARMQLLAASYKDLEHQDRAKDQFLSTVSHELRTPLGIVIGWINLLRDDKHLSLEATKAVEIIARNAKIQNGIIDDLLDMFRIRAGKMRVEIQDHVDLRILIDKVVESLRPPMMTKGIQLLWHPTEDAMISADPDRISQILWNLLINAQKFTPSGGKIWVRLAMTATTAVIEVEDTGVGIDPAKLDDIFERHVQEPNGAVKAGGLGIGLSIVRGLSELHGGSARAYSKGCSMGARFVVELPIHNLSVAPGESAVADASKDAFLKGLHVLIAEDQPDALAFLSVLCERIGGVVARAKDGCEALELLRSQKFDLILSDLSMPGLTGFQLLQTWRAEEELRHALRTPAIAVSAYASPKDRAKSLEAGFTAHVSKPIYRDELFAVIKSLGLKR